MKLYYNKLGSGPSLFILHGLFGMSDNWLTVGKKLAESFTVYLVDLRNFGQSPHSEEWTYPAMAEDINELMEDVQIDKSTNRQILLGHSMGGKVAMQFASMYPEKLEKLIVVDMTPKYYATDNNMDFTRKLLQVNLNEMASRKEAEEKILSLVEKKSIAQLLLKNIEWKNSPPSPLFQKERGDEVGESSSREVLAWKLNLKVIAENVDGIEKTFSLGEKPIDIPTLFIRGERSNYILDSDIPEIKKIFPNSEFKTITDAGHWVHADKPEEFVEAVKEFIA